MHDVNSTKNQATMTALFRRINPAQKFRITKHQIAKFLRIPESLIVKIESWLYVVFVHRLDKGGQFISYRQMEQWKNAIACQLQKCSTQQQLQHLWNAIEHDHIKHNKQYRNSVLPFLKKIMAKCLSTEADLLQNYLDESEARTKELAPDTVQPPTPPTQPKIRDLDC
jgi:lysine/ornithine N-monooxygenase